MNWLLFFFKEKADEIKLLKNIDAFIQKVTDSGFLKILKGTKQDEYEVMRILKARFTVDTLQELKNKLKYYSNTETTLYDESSHKE